MCKLFVPTESSFLTCKYGIVTNQSLSGYTKSVNISNTAHPFLILLSCIYTTSVGIYPNFVF